MLIVAVQRPEVRTTIVLLITTVAVALLHRKAVIPAEATAVHARHTAAVVEVLPVHPVAAVVVAVAEAEDKHEQQKLKL